MEPQQHEITRALLEAGDGDEAAAGRLWAMVYEELRQIAHRELLGERRGHTLSTTALVHEAYLRLVDQTRITWQNRSHFFALSCKAMRRILVDFARRRNAEKRQAQKEKVPLEEAAMMATSRSAELVALDEALERLSARDPRLGQVVECRFFGGLSVKETAEVLGIAKRTVERDWSRALAYLQRALHPDSEP
jgi:RNA polymerase sigma factor (TIGR02999 family)